MANLYGVANAPGIPQVAATLSGGANVSCPAGVYTTVHTSNPFIAPSQGFFYAIAWMAANLTMGASLPSGINISIAIGAGSYVNEWGFSPIWAVANGSYVIPFVVVTPPSQVAWQGAGSTVSIGINPALNALTCAQYSPSTIVLFRAPDQ